jgi:hypothetical protein
MISDWTDMINEKSNKKWNGMGPVKKSRVIWPKRWPVAISVHTLHSYLQVVHSCLQVVPTDCLLIRHWNLTIFSGSIWLVLREPCMSQRRGTFATSWFKSSNGGQCPVETSQNVHSETQTGAAAIAQSDSDLRKVHPAWTTWIARKNGFWSILPTRRRDGKPAHTRTWRQVGWWSGPRHVIPNNAVRLADYSFDQFEVQSSAHAECWCAGYYSKDAFRAIHSSEL